MPLTPGKPVVKGGAHWIAEGNLHVGIAFLEGARNSTQSTATADGAREAVEILRHGTVHKRLLHKTLDIPGFESPGFESCLGPWFSLSL